MKITDGKSAATEARIGMKGQVEHVQHELSGVRTGRASVGLLDSVRVEAYGTQMPLNQVATLSVPESTLIAAHPFDPTQIGAIERAIQSANLGLNPSNDGKVVRIPIPALTDERRKELSRIVHTLSEEARNGVRNTRRHVNEALKKLLKTNELSEDDERRALDDVQKVTDDHIHQIDALQKAKDAELLEQ
jgi:ribosome recycling factor